jgi:hypothetical protein
MLRLQRLPKVRGEAQKRIPRSGSFSPRVEAKIEALCRKHDASRSRIIVTIVSEFFRIKDGGFEE